MPRNYIYGRGNSHLSSRVLSIHSLNWVRDGGRVAIPQLGKPAAASVVLFRFTTRPFSVRAKAAAQNQPIGLTRNVYWDGSPRTPSRGTARFQTPSEVLLEALKERGYDTGDYTATKNSRIDLSWVDPNDDNPDERRPERMRKQPAKASGKISRMSYATIVAGYIRDVEPLLRLASCSESFAMQREDHLDEAILTAFDDQAVEYLSSRGYSVEDVVSWAWILTSKTAHTAALRYMEMENNQTNGKGGVGPPIPPFVLVFILRREKITARTLGILLPIAARMLQTPPGSKPPTNLDVAPRKRKEPMQSTPWHRGDSATAMIIVARLLRLAQNVSPPALQSVAGIFMAVFGVDAMEERFGKSPGQNNRSYLTQLYNRCLVLMSNPCRINPYQSVTLQHRVAFQLLREMTKFDPPLSVSRKGYQAIIRIQAMREKSGPEREWGSLKGPSWPPWKQEKIGIDAERGNEGKKSMAMKALSLMTKSGYPMTRWEEVASIVSGWDTDGTPTIQTRTILPKPNKSEEDDFSVPTDPGAQTHSHPDIWAARIRATRTLNEAWACFLGFREEHHHLVHSGVYFEMIQKLAYAERINGLTQLTGASSEAIPGDGREVFHEPSSPRDALYVPSNPRQLHDFVQDMLTANITLSKRLLVLVLAHVDYELGLNCLESSSLSDDEVRSVKNRPERAGPDELWHLGQIPDYMFAAIIDFFGRSFHSRTLRRHGLRWSFPIATSSRFSWHREQKLVSLVEPDRALAHICDMLCIRSSRTPQPWNILLSHLKEPRVLSSRVVTPDLQRVIIWTEIREVVRWMDRDSISLDMDTLEILCRSLIAVIIAHRRHALDIERRLKSLWHGDILGKNTVWSMPRETVPQMIREGLELIKRRFYLLVSHPSPTVASSLPKPQSIQLHWFIRALGLAGDHDGLLTVLWWISESEEDLVLTTHERLKGPVHMRRAMVAIRVFLEGHLDMWGETGSLDTPSDEIPSIDTVAEQLPQKGRPKRHVHTAREIFQKLKLLEGWPTDEEMTSYLTADPECQTGVGH